MPHIVLDGKIDLESISEKFKPIFHKSDSLIKIKEMYVNSKRWNALFSALVIDDSHQEFFIEVATRDKKTTIRLFPLTDPQKTDSVKQAMVLVFQIIKKEYHDLRISKTNLQSHLKSVSLP